MHPPKVIAGLAVLVLVGLAAVACGGDGDGNGNGGGDGDQNDGRAPDVEVAVALSEWAVAAEASVGSGEVRFDVTNDGATVHQLAVYRSGSLEGDSIDGGTLVARTGNIQAGGTDALQASLEPGDYWLVCPIPGHTASGMSTPLTVGS